MVISTLKLVSSPKRHPVVLEILRSVVGPAQSQPGCLSCAIYGEDGPDQATVLCGQWKTTTALYDHIRSELYHLVLAACELSTRPPEFCFHHVSKTQGMALVHALRGHGKVQPPAL
jgi:quinol monooxygenase YgiN